MKLVKSSFLRKIDEDDEEYLRNIFLKKNFLKNKHRSRLTNAHLGDYEFAVPHGNLTLINYLETVSVISVINICVGVL